MKARSHILSSPKKLLINMSEEEILSKKLIIFVISAALIILTVGLILIYLGYNIYFNELYYNDLTMYSIFLIITYLGSTVPQILIIAALWFAYDKKYAKNLAFCLLGSYYVNSVLKDIFQDPRPWTKRETRGFGFPSGHAQSAATMWGYLAYHTRNKNKYLPWIFLILIYLIAISRIIIGVHDIQDIIGGLIFGIIFLMTFIIIEPNASNIINKMNIISKIIMTILIPIMLFIVALMIFPNTELDYGFVCGAMMGLSLGYLIECEKVQYDPTQIPRKQRIINLVIGLTITLVLYFIINLIPFTNQVWYFIAYFVLSFLLVTLVPWIFIKIQK